MKLYGGTTEQFRADAQMHRIAEKLRAEYTTQIGHRPASSEVATHGVGDRMTSVTSGPWALDVDIDATRDAYAQISEGAEACGCDHCEDWARVRSTTIPQEVRDFLAGFGVDWRREAEVYELDPRRASRPLRGPTACHGAHSSADEATPGGTGASRGPPWRRARLGSPRPQAHPPE